MPRSLVEELTRVSSFAQKEWAAARQDADFARFQPWLEKLLALKRSEADCLGYQDHPYDALLEDYEPGTRTAQLSDLFAALRHDLVPLAHTLAYGRRRPAAAILSAESIRWERQRYFCELAAGTIGFDFQAGRLDSTNPSFFTTVGPGEDAAITTRLLHSQRWSDGFFGTLHETGHALYEQGLDAEHHGTPLGEAASVAVHESQARLWENTVGRSQPFWEYFFPIAKQVFPAALHDVKLEDFFLAVNNVEATFIRVTADEVTYNLHILIRFELEQALVAGDLQPGDLPEAWNSKYRHYLGITPANDADGCLQDGHWAAGMFGYFPTYTLGNLFAAQLFARAREVLGDLGPAFAGGDFSGLLNWLRRTVHLQGSRYPAARLIELVTGSPPDHRPFIQALRQKYSELYRQ